MSLYKDRTVYQLNKTTEVQALPLELELNDFV